MFSDLMRTLTVMALTENCLEILAERLPAQRMLEILSFSRESSTHLSSRLGSGLFPVQFDFPRFVNIFLQDSPEPTGCVEHCSGLAGPDSIVV